MARAPIDEIINALGFAIRPRFWKEDDEFGRTRRPAMSAGALHPFSVLIIPGREDHRLFRYDAVEHCLETLRTEVATLKVWFEHSAELLPDADGSALILVADIAKQEAVYERAESLAWRDAGALVQTIAMVCTAYHLAFCPLGLLGSEIVATLGAPDRLVAAGTALVGQSVPVPKPAPR
jgi:SagB-type dehydrogenase family enzyme